MCTRSDYYVCLDQQPISYALLLYIIEHFCIRFSEETEQKSEAAVPKRSLGNAQDNIPNIVLVLRQHRPRHGAHDVTQNVTFPIK